MLPFTAYLILLLHLITNPSSPTIDFLFNSFNTTDLLLANDARIDSSIIRMTNDSSQFSIGRAFFPTQLPMKNTTTNTTSSFSTTFIFSILPRKRTNPGFGFVFVLSSTISPARALPGQYFGIFSNATGPVAPLLAVEFDTGRNPEFNDPDDDHVGIDLNNIVSAYTEPAGYWKNTTEFVGIDMKSGQNIQAWVEFDGAAFQINVTIAPAGIPKPKRPLIAYQNPAIANYTSDKMYVGFSASKVTHVEAQRILAWSLRNTGVARELNTSNLPVFMSESLSSSSPTALIAGISSGAAVFLLLCGALVLYLLHRRRIQKKKEEEAIEDWELEYWPHRFTYEELHKATEGFAKNQLLGYGGFGKVYKGVLVNSNNAEVAVKCVAHDSKQGVREFIAEISSMGRMQHRSLVQMRGWCRKGTELMLVYDFMPNGSLNKWIFGKPEKLLGWEGRRRVLADVAEGLLYLHHGWDQIVLHRDIKASNILLDANMRGKLGDFGLARLYQHGQAPSSTRVVGTLGYLAPELANVPMPTTSSDVFSFGVVMLEVACGRRPIETWSDDETLLIDWVRELYVAGRLLEAADSRIAGEYKVEEMDLLLKLGLACCHPEPEHRPSMNEVASVLLGDEVAVPSDLLSDLTRICDQEEPSE